MQKASEFITPVVHTSKGATRTIVCYELKEGDKIRTFRTGRDGKEVIETVTKIQEMRPARGDFKNYERPKCFTVTVV